MGDVSSFTNVAGVERRRVAPQQNVTSQEYMFVLGREERFESVASNTSATEKTTRRPFGQEFKSDTFAYIEVLRQDVKKDGLVQYKPLAIFNENFPASRQKPSRTEPTARGNASDVTDLEATNVSIDAAQAPYANNFIIQQTSEVREEKFQLLETFGDNFAFFFGERPRFYDVTGLLLNSNSHRWKKEWWLNYDTYLRGTRAVENKSVVTLHVDDVAISGYLLTSNAVEVSDAPRQLQFTFRMLVTDYVFEDDPGGLALNWFNDNLLVTQAPDERSALSKLRNVGTQTGKYLNNSITQAAISTITQAVFSNPLAGVTNAAAASASIFESFRSFDLDENDAAEGLLLAGAGSFVEFQGKPPGVYSPDGRRTLQEEGIDNLVASVDNSLAILLNLEQSPVVQMVSSVGKLIEGAIASLGGSQVGFASNSRQKYSEHLSRADKTAGRGAIATGRYMGFDFVMPFNGLQIDTVNPTPSKVNGIDPNASTEEKIAAGDYGSQEFNDFYIFSPVTGSDVDFDKLKADPNYHLLPRSWRLRIEKDPAAMSQKIISSSRRNGTDDLKLILRRSKTVARTGSTLLDKLNAVSES